LFREENDHINTLTNYGVYKELSGLLKKAKICPEKAWMEIGRIPDLES